MRRKSWSNDQRVPKKQFALRSCFLLMILGYFSFVGSMTHSADPLDQKGTEVGGSAQVRAGTGYTQNDRLDAFRAAAKVLQSRCLSCHQDGVNEGDFSLSTLESAKREGHVGGGGLETSRLWEVVKPINGIAEMPKDGEPITESELKAIKRWIETGAFWPEGKRLEPAAISSLDWWSFQPIDRPQIPKVESLTEKEREEQNPVDAFIQQTLLKHDLLPSPIADRRTLLRRLKFDLLGLPPTVEEVRAFEQDTDPEFYSKWVDRFLASEHYGERWARHWLDVVKYADTCGYDKDKLRENAWPYRDYVIRSMNQDKPYAKFIREQIAGDVFYEGEPDGILGLGFIAAGPWDFIGHVEVPESKLDGKVARNLDRDDMVSGVFNTFCSLTVQCARCHHHKFDPISQEQYYGLQAVFAAVDRADRPYDTDPDTERRRTEYRQAIDEAKSRISAIDKAMEKEGGEELKQLNQRFTSLENAAQIQKDPEFGYHSQIVKDADSVKWVEVDLGRESSIESIELQACHDEYANIGAGFGFPVRYRVELFRGVNDSSAHYVIDRTDEDQKNPGIQPVRIEFDSPQSVRRIRVTAVKLMERKNDFHFSLAELRVMGVGGENIARDCQVKSLDSIEAPVRWAKANLTDGKWAQYQDPVKAQELFVVGKQRDVLLERIQTPQRIKEKADWQKKMSEAESGIQKLPAGKMVYAAATHFSPQGNFKPTAGKPRAIHVLARGEINKPLQIANAQLLPLSAEKPASIQADAPESQRRAALAEWLTDDSHPLVWRSIVNRVWLYHFGQGIVTTPNDFGKMGAKPSHPDLLDWLATEFRDGGKWIKKGSIKDLHRLIVNSQTYRQRSDHDEAKSTIDSDNTLLWRMNRRRLEAEEIRDAIMFVSDSLNLTMGGPGYRLFELERPEHSPHYEYHKFDHRDASTHRRSIYRFIVRSQPDPWMTTMDCADSSQSTPVRDETLTALQSLSLLNNQFNLVMAERFERALDGETSMSEKVRLAFSKAMQREPSKSDHQAMLQYARQHGLNNLCRLLFNFSEFIYID